VLSVVGVGGGVPHGTAPVGATFGSLVEPGAAAGATNASLVPVRFSGCGSVCSVTHPS
jgi:hypothetical protein